ncbi:MAG: J domain-containing protein [Planctomycetaceae bacterium]
MSTSASADPYAILGVSQGAGEAEIRARYLELVKQFPPERDPDEFRKVRAAFEAAKDPLVLARRLIEPPGEKPPPWTDAIEKHKQFPPALTPGFLLSLGNRDPEYRAAIDAPRPGDAARDSDTDRTAADR